MKIVNTASCFECDGGDTFETGGSEFAYVWPEANTRVGARGRRKNSA